MAVVTKEKKESLRSNPTKKGLYWWKTNFDVNYFVKESGDIVILSEMLTLWS